MALVQAGVGYAGCSCSVHYCASHSEFLCTTTRCEGWTTTSRVWSQGGLLVASDEVWTQAVHRAEMIAHLAKGAVVGHEAADAAAAELGSVR